MKALSKSAEKTILKAIEQVCEKVADGMNPTAAVTKVASDMSLSRNYINLVCSGYNTGATTYQREKSADISNKLAKFELAIPEKVAEAIFPTKVEKPSILKQSTAVRDVYAQRPSGTSRELIAAQVKLASAPLPKIEYETLHLHDTPEYKAKQSINKMSAARKKEAAARGDYVAAQDALLYKLNGLVETVKAGTDWSFEQLDYATQNKHGAAGRAIMNYVHTATRPKEKRSAAYPVVGNPIDWSAPVFTEIVECIKSAQAVNKLKVAYTRAIAEKQVTHNAAYGIQPKEPPKPERTIFGTEKDSGAMSFILGNQIAKSIFPQPEPSTMKSPKDKATDLATDIADPQHDDALRAIQTRTMLQDLMSNDEIISGYDPDDVISAYNEVAQLSPRASTQPAVIRPLLRKQLSQGGLEPFEAAEMANIEKSVTESTNPRNPTYGNVPQR